MLDYHFWRHRVPFKEGCWLCIDPTGEIFCANREPMFEDGEWVLGAASLEPGVEMRYMGLIGDAPGDEPEWEDPDDPEYIEYPEDQLWIVPELTNKDQLRYFELQHQWVGSGVRMIKRLAERPAPMEPVEIAIPLEDWDFFSPPEEWPKRISKHRRLHPGRIGLFVAGEPCITFPYFAYEFVEENEDVIQRAAKAVAA